jgi:hypothetical protein
MRGFCSSAGNSLALSIQAEFSTGMNSACTPAAIGREIAVQSSQRAVVQTPTYFTIALSLCRNVPNVAD